VSHVSAREKALGKVARFLQSTVWFRRFVFCKSAGSEVLMEGAMKSEYDLHSAVTFFLVGVGVGSVLALVFNPRRRIASEAVNNWRRAA
jgi:hypothetical protein